MAFIRLLCIECKEEYLLFVSLSLKLFLSQLSFFINWLIYQIIEIFQYIIDCEFCRISIRTVIT